MGVSLGDILCFSCFADSKKFAKVTDPFQTLCHCEMGRWGNWEGILVVSRQGGREPQHPFLGRLALECASSCHTAGQSHEGMARSEGDLQGSAFSSTTWALGLKAGHEARGKALHLLSHTTVIFCPLTLPQIPFSDSALTSLFDADVCLLLEFIQAFIHLFERTHHPSLF